MGSKFWLLTLSVLFGGLAFSFVNSSVTLVNPLSHDASSINDNDKRALANTPKPSPALAPRTSHPPKTLTVVNTSAMQRTLSPIERIRTITDKTNLQKSLINEHDKFKRYPPQNQRINEAHQDPITQRYAVDERTTLNEDNTFGMTIWSDQKYYLAQDTVQLFAYVQDANGLKLAGEFSAILQDANQQTLISITLSDKNQDRVYESDFQLSEKLNGQSTLTPGIYKVLIHNTQYEIIDALTFTLAQPDISLTGNYQEKITDSGDLLIEAEVQVSLKNRFYVQASLYSATQVPIGVTQFSGDLAAGKHWVPLVYAGLMIKDGNESGPYVLDQISVAKVTMPMQRGPSVTPDYQTQSYGLDEFSGQSYTP
jgi:hypothetical protein